MSLSARYPPQATLSYGGWINNTFGTTAGVTISGSSTAFNQFNENTNYGLHIRSNGAISIKYSEFKGNGSFGAYFYNNTAGATAGITIMNCNIIGNDAGLLACSNGPIILNTVQASSNPWGGGATLENLTSLSSPGVTISNSIFWDNSSTGLYIRSKGNILLTNTAAWDNDGVAGASGAYLNNTFGTGYVKISNPKSTDLDMYAGFNTNHDIGLNIYTNGMVTLTNVNLIDNADGGIAVWQELNKGVTMNNCRVDENGGHGIIIETIGPITINGGHANDNSGIGVMANNLYAIDALPKPVTIKNFTANGNSGYGIFVTSKGAIALSSVTANDTVGGDYAAIWLENNVAGALTPAVTLSKVYANYNIYRGVYVLSNGVVKYLTGEASS